MVKNSYHYHNFYVLIYKKECFLTSLEGVKFEIFSRPLNEKKFFFKESQSFEILKLGNYAISNGTTLPM